MKAIRNTVVRFAVVTLLVLPLVGCGVENAVGPVADRTPVATSDARMGASNTELARANLVVQDPGTPNDDSQLSASASGADYYAGSGSNGNAYGHAPKFHKKPRRH